MQKVKESAHMSYAANPISQPSLVTSPVLIPIIRKEVGKSQSNSAGHSSTV
jgi:hypothetical protein